MYCKECKISIGYITDTCPLCLARIKDVDSINNLVYPRRNAAFRFPMKYSFSMVYIIIAISVFVISLLVNLITTPRILWSIIAGAGLIYLYVLVRHTILASDGSAAKVAIHAAVLSGLIVIIQIITRSGNWAYNYVVPFVLVINTIVLWAFAIIRYVKRANYALALLAIAILTLVPSLLYIFGYSDVFWTAIMSLTVSILSSIAVVILFGNLLIGEIKRLFHM